MEYIFQYKESDDDDEDNALILDDKIPHEIPAGDSELRQKLLNLTAKWIQENYYVYESPEALEEEEKKDDDDDDVWQLVIQRKIVRLFKFSVLFSDDDDDEAAAAT